MAITNNAEPFFVNLPSLDMESGKIAGHMSELAKPSKAIKITELKPVVTNAPMENKTPKAAHIAKAFD